MIISMSSSNMLSIVIQIEIVVEKQCNKTKDEGEMNHDTISNKQHTHNSEQNKHDWHGTSVMSTKRSGARRT